MLAQDKDKSECEECGEVRYTYPTFHGNICHQCEEKLDTDDSEVNPNGKEKRT